MRPYFADDTVTLYVGDCREILPQLGVTADLVLADPPYGETSLAWDRWPDGWLDVTAQYADSLWCFGSTRMFFEHLSEFDGWKLSQDVVWEKRNGTSFAADRFRRVHEHILHWYRGSWAGVHHDVPRIPAVYNAKGRTRSHQDKPAHTGSIGTAVYVDDGLRLARTVQRYPSVRRGIHRSQKPVELLDLLIRYACPPDGLVIDPFAGSGSTLDAARQSGRKAIGIEANEAYAEKAARRLEQLTIDAS
jgi:site-specific DNA-methyltransferase (adenine-specific)